MKDEYDFSNSQRGKFYKPDLRLIPPVRLEPQVLDFLAKRAEAKGTTLNALLNTLLKKDIELIDFLDAGFSNGPGQCLFADFSRQRLAPLFGELLGVVQAGDRACRIKNHRSRHHRPRQRAAPGLVYPADEAFRHNQFRHSMTARAAFSALFCRRRWWISVKVSATAAAFSLSS